MKFVFPTVLKHTVVACASTFVTASFAQISNCPFSVDSSSARDATRDGLLLIRYAQKKTGAELVQGTGADPTAVANTIASNLARLDVNGNGRFDTDDAMIITRVLNGFTGDARLAAAAAGPSAGLAAVRSTTTAIETYLNGGCANTFAAAKTALAPQVALTGANRAANVQAARFLTRGTFGPTLADARALNARAGANFTAKATAWVDEQLNKPLGPKFFTYVTNENAGDFSNDVMRDAWWQRALTADDQLRQRTAFALSQIMVVSSNGNSNSPYVLAGYMDMLSDNSFGNFRDLLKGVARSPAMGRYLDHLRNDGNNSNPNENFAREVLQLFTIGLVKLDASGNPQAGNPATYSEDNVKAFANAFTGMSFDDDRTAADRCPENATETLPNWFWSPDNKCSTAGSENKASDRDGWRRPMRMYDNRYSNREKILLNYTAPSVDPLSTADNYCTATRIAASLTLPAIAAEPGFTSGTRVSAATGTAMLERAIDNLVCHPNVGPFIAKSLIRFFVSSTPTDAYVRRVAQKFDNNGSGVRGDMKAVMRAILLDSEALTPSTTLAAADFNKFGKLKEPMLRYSQTLRAFSAYSLSGKYRLNNLNSPESGIAQNILQSPSVFNFYHPEFAPPGPVATAGAEAPEFEITTTTSIAGTANTLGSLVTRTAPRDSGFRQHAYASVGNCNPFASPAVGVDCIRTDYSDLYALVDDAQLMIDYLNVVLMGGTLPDAARGAYAAAVDSAYPYTTGACVLPAAPNDNQINSFDDCRGNRVKSALWLTMHSPEFQIQQ
ncbi:MAG: DUF1800 domain-containing protein [Casimicrobium sp.]